MAEDPKREILKTLDIHAFYESEVERLGKPDSKGQAMGLCPFHNDTTPSCSFNFQTGHFNCFGCGEKGSIFDFCMKKHGVDFSTALSDLRKIAGSNGHAGVRRRRKRKAVQQFFDPVNIESITYYELGKPNDIYVYTCEQGVKHYLYVCRFDPMGDRKEKTFRQCRPDGKGGVIWSTKDIKLVPYRLPELSESKYCFLVEGEKDVDTLKRIGLVASCNPMGAGNWPDDLNQYFTDKKIAILPDNDKPGRKHALKVARSLHGIAASIKMVELPDLPAKSDVTDWLEDAHTKDELLSLAKQAAEWRPEGQVEEVDQAEPESEPSKWDKVRELFPRVPFPWEVLPAKIAASLQQLARSHATSPLSLPGAAMAIFGSVLGSTVNVSPKRSWREPLIFWFADVRQSGSGKTPAMRALCKVLYEAQTQADEDYKQRLEEERAKKKKDQRPVPRAKSYFITELTLEGLRADSTGHGGSVCVLDELSSFINGQNQYKAKGNDRESWIALHDGNPARIVRAKESFTISGSRISIVGGIQPVVWQVSFGSEKGLFLTDGTVYRFLVTYEGDQFYRFTNESWSDQNRKNWEQPLTVAMEWADTIIADEDWKPKTICLSDDAQELFFDWCNILHESKSELPDQFKGYIPKLIGYSLRLAGVLYCMNHFATGSFPGLILDRKDMQNGIDAVAFYAGHLVDAAQSLSLKKPVVPFEITEQVKHLATTIESLRSEIESGRLAIGYIQECFNELASDEQKIKTPHAMGALLRKCGLTIPAGHFRANKKIKVKCLLWDKKTDSFLKQVHKVLFVHNSINHAGSEARTLKKQSPRLRILERQAMWTKRTLRT